MAVNKITGFRAPYKSDTFRDIVDSMEGMNGVLDIAGPITQAGPTITVPAFIVVQDGLIYEKTTPTALSEPSITAPFYLVVTSPTPNNIDDLLFTFAKTAEDLTANEVVLGSYDGFEWRLPQKISIKGILELIRSNNIDTLRVGPFQGLRTSLNGTNYDNSPGSLVDKQGEAQHFANIASFPVVDVDPDFDRVDRIVYRRPTDFPSRIGTREFLLGGTYDASPVALPPLESFDSAAVRQKQKVLVGTDNAAHILSSSGSGSTFTIDYTKIASDRLSALVAPLTLVLSMTTKNFGAAIDGSDNIHVVYEKAGNIFYQKFDSAGVNLVVETVIDTQAGACRNPAISIDPGDTKVFIAYQALLGPSNYQIFFTTRTLAGFLITSPKNLTANAQNIITPDIFASEDLYVYVTWANQTTGAVLFRRFDDIGNPLDATATTVSAGVVQIGVGTLTGGAIEPRVIVAGNREVIVAFRQDKGGGVYGISVYTKGSAFMPQLLSPTENFSSFDITTDPIYNSLLLALGQATSTDFVKVFNKAVSFTLNLQASGSRGVSLARDRFGSLIHAFSGAAAGTFTSYDAAALIKAFGPVSLPGGIATVNVGANQFLLDAASISQPPAADDQVVITGSLVPGNNVTKQILAVELLSLDAVDDVYRVTVLNNFSAVESPSPASGDFQTPDGNNASYRKSVSEEQNTAFAPFELESDILLSRMVPPGNVILNWLPPGDAGSLSDFLIIGGSGTVDWEKTAAGAFTLVGIAKLTNVFTSTEYLIAPGTFPMAESEALYVVLDPSDLNPTPQVSPLAILPWNQPIGVIGMIVDGVFEPAMSNLRPLIPQEEMVMGQALPVAIRDRLGVVNDVEFEPYVSLEHIAETDNYPQAISNLDTAVQNVIGQIFMTAAEPISTRVKISGADKTFFSGSLFGTKYRERLISFDGAEIDFATGQIYAADGLTPLGVNFTPVVPAANSWRWFAVNLLPGSLLPDNRVTIRFQVTPAPADGATQADAPRASFTNQPDVGQVALFSADGLTISAIDYGNLLNLLTHFMTAEGSGGGGGDGSSPVILSGFFNYSWEAAAAGEFVFSAGMRIEDLSSGAIWLPVDGIYPMAEGDAIYIVLDTSALTPTPIVTPIAALPVASIIYVIGIVRDGQFVPDTPSLNILESGEGRTAGEDLSTTIADRLGVFTDTSFAPYTSIDQMDPDGSYPEALSSLDEVITNILRQVSLVPKSPGDSRVVITGADKVLFNGSVLGVQVDSLLVDFQGAEIDFDTGAIYEPDGVTPLGLDFTPVIPGTGLWRWFAVTLESTVVTPDNRLQFRVIVTPAEADGADQNVAIRAEFDSGPKVGEVAITSADGIAVDPILNPNLVNLLTLDMGGGGGGSTVLKAVAGEDLLENDLVYISPGVAIGDTGRITGQVYLVDAGNLDPALAAIRSQAAGFVLAPALASDDVKVALGGTRKNFSGLTIGVQYYADPLAPGSITTLKPVAEGQWIVPVGVPRSAVLLDINPGMSSDAELVPIVVSATDLDVIQVTHGFIVGQPIYFDGVLWQLAKADSSFTMAEGLVKEVADANNFTLRVVGPIAGLTGLVPGAYYFTDAVTAGALTDTEPSAPFLSNPVGFALSATDLMVLPLRPSGGGTGAPSEITTLPAGETLAANDQVYLSPGNAQGDTARTQGSLYKVDAGNADPLLAAIRARAIGFAKFGAIAGGSLDVQIAGEMGGFSALIPGYPYYADPLLPGALTSIKPVAIGQWVVPSGIGKDLTTLYTNPSAGSDATLVDGGGGGGTGDASTLTTLLENQLQESIYDLLTACDFAIEEDTLIDAGGSTGTFTAGKFEFGAPGEIMGSINLLDPEEFLAFPSLLTQAEVTVFWTPGAIDPDAEYAFSRDGGVNWQTIPTSRVGYASNCWTGNLVFAAEADSTLLTNSAAETNTYEMNTGAQSVFQQAFQVPDASVLRVIQIEMVKTGTPVGSWYVDICADNGGSPGNILGSTSGLSVSALTSALTNVDVSDLALKGATDYWIVVRTDALYKASFAAGVTAISLSRNASGLRQNLLGYPLDLRLRVTSSLADVSLQGFGAFYNIPMSQAQSVSGSIKRDVKSFRTTENLNSFAINFIADPNLLVIYHVETGQVYVFPSFALSGQTVTFPANTFASSVDELVTLIFVQIQGGSFDNSDLNAALLAANHLGSTDGQIDKSAPGRGIFLRRPDGTLREIALDDNDNITVYSV